VPRLDLGYGLSAFAFPGFDLTFSNPVLQEAGATSVWRRLARELANQPVEGGNYPTTPDGFEGLWQLRNWVDTADLPFFTARPQRMIGSGREIPGILPLGTMVLDLRGEAPQDGLWFASLIRGFAAESRFFRDPGPWHHSSATGVLWDGAGPPDMPFDIRTGRQVFANYKAWLEVYEESPGNNKLKMTCRLWVVAVWGRQMDFDWSVPVVITWTDIDCPADGLLEGGDATACSCAAEDGGLGEIGCYCTCEDGVWQMPDCQRLEVSFNNLRQGSCADPPCQNLPYPECHPGHKNYLTELFLTGSRSHEYVVDWPYDLGAGEVTSERVRTRLANHPLLAGPFATLSELVRAGFAAGPFDDVAVELHPTQQPTVKSVIRFTVNTESPALPEPEDYSGETTYIGDPDHPFPIEVVEHPVPYCAPSLRAVWVSSAAGYIAWLRDQFRGMCTHPDPWWAGADGDEGNLRNRIDADSFVEEWVKQSCYSSNQTALRFACRMLAYYLGTQSLRSALQTREATELTNVPLLTGCYHDNPGVPDGVDPATNEGVYGILGPFSGGCPSLLAWKRNGDVCEPYANWFYSITNINQCGFPPQHGTMLKSPSIPENYNDSGICDFPCWRPIAAGGYNCLLGFYLPAEFCEFNPNHPWCQYGGSGDPAQSCGWIYDDNWSLHHSDDEWPKYFIFQRPYLEIRVKIEGCKLKVRAHYMTWVLRENRCWDAAADPDEWAGWGIAPTFMGYLEVGRGASFEAPIGVVSPLGGVLPHELWTRVQSESILLGGCRGTPPPRIDLEGDGNTLAIEL